jgi:hypothetical protein
MIEAVKPLVVGAAIIFVAFVTFANLVGDVVLWVLTFGYSRKERW